MAAQTSLPALLDSLSNSLNSALEAAPKLSSVIEPSKDSVSLLDVKNELLLSYLQNLVFLILLKIRSARDQGEKNADANTKNGDENREGRHETGEPLSDTVVEKLVELRLYLEKGVRPLEGKLRFQLDKILRAADNADRGAQQADARAKARKASEGEFESGSEDSSSEDGDDDEENTKPTTRDLSAKNYTPGAHGFITARKPVGMAAAAASGDKMGVYRPPKIAPTVMPTTERRERAERRQPAKSATMDEDVSRAVERAAGAAQCRRRHRAPRTRRQDRGPARRGGPPPRVRGVQFRAPAQGEQEGARQARPGRGRRRRQDDFWW